MDPFGKKNVRNNPTHQVSFLDQLKMKQAQRGVEKGNSEIVHESVSTKKAPVKNEGLSLPSESFNRKKKDNEFGMVLFFDYNFQTCFCHHRHHPKAPATIHSLQN